VINSTFGSVTVPSPAGNPNPVDGGIAEVVGGADGSGDGDGPASPAAATATALVRATVFLRTADRDRTSSP